MTIFRAYDIYYSNISRERNLVLILLQVTSGFELYAAFSPLVTKPDAINAINKLLRWIKVRYFWKQCPLPCVQKWSTMEPRFYDRRSNDIPDLTINILCPGKRFL